MLILALESSAKPVSVAVYESFQDDNCNGGSAGTSGITSTGGKLLGQYFQNNGFSHSRTLMSMTHCLLDNLGLKPGDMDMIAVANGPGSFTGVRIGVSFAKGLAIGLDIPVCGVSSLESMARQLISDNNPMLVSSPGGVPAESKIQYLCPVMDARRNQVYNALFKVDNGALVRLCDDRAVSLEQLAEDLSGYGVPFSLVGDGIDITLSTLGGDKRLQLLTPCTLSEYQTAYGVALAAVFAQASTGAELEPVYLRPSQAEREHNLRTK